MAIRGVKSYLKDFYPDKLSSTGSLPGPIPLARRRSRSRIRESEDRGNAMIWAVAIVGLLLVGWGAYREYFAESEETEGEGSILTNGLFISGVTLLAGTSLYGMYRLLA